MCYSTKAPQEPFVGAGEALGGCLMRFRSRIKGQKQVECSVLPASINRRTWHGLDELFTQHRKLICENEARVLNNQRGTGGSRSGEKSYL